MRRSTPRASPAAAPFVTLRRATGVGSLIVALIDLPAAHRGASIHRTVCPRLTG